MSIGLSALKSELVTQTIRLNALNATIFETNCTQQFLIYTAPKTLKEIEEEVCRIASRSHVFPNKFEEPVAALWATCDSIEEFLDGTYIFLSERILNDAQALSIGTLKEELGQTIEQIRAIYTSQFRQLKASTLLTSNLTKAEKLLQTQHMQSKNV